MRVNENNKKLIKIPPGLWRLDLSAYQMNLLLFLIEEKNSHKFSLRKIAHEMNVTRQSVSLAKNALIEKKLIREIANNCKCAISLEVIFDEFKKCKDGMGVNSDLHTSVNSDLHTSVNSDLPLLKKSVNSDLHTSVNSDLPLLKKSVNSDLSTSVNSDLATSMSISHSKPKDQVVEIIEDFSDDHKYYIHNNKPKAYLRGEASPLQSATQLASFNFSVSGNVLEFSEAEKSLAQEWAEITKAHWPHIKINLNSWLKDLRTTRKSLNYNVEQMRSLMLAIYQNDFWKDKVQSPLGLRSKSRSNGLRKIDNILTTLRAEYNETQGLRDWIREMQEKEEK